MRQIPLTTYRDMTAIYRNISRFKGFLNRVRASLHLCPALLLTVCMGSAQAGEAQLLLEQFLTDLTTLQTQFIQSVHDPKKGRLEEESKGVMSIARPGRFHLLYREPYEQIYVADGTHLWLYDRDLEQVTVKEQEPTLGNTPLLLLSSADRAIQDQFSFTELGRHEGFLWLELRPKEIDASFEYMRIAMEEDTLRALEMIDGFGQTTRLYLIDLQRNPRLKDELFVFEPPPGVDVIGDVNVP